MNTLLRSALAGLCAGLFAFACAPSLAQPAGYPDKPIRLVVPYPPGGFTDILGRLIAQKLGPALGQPVIVDNRGGGGSTIGSSIVAKADPDGYTLLLVAADLAINESLIPNRLTYDAQKDFRPIIRAAWSPMVLVTNPAFPPKTLGELIALAKASPNTINFASGGNGTGSHLALEMLKSRAGIRVLHVPYKGNGPALSDLLGGQVQAMFLQYAVARPQLASGKLRALATPSGHRSAAMPDIPTIAESGLPGFDVQPWFGIVAPAATPDAIVTKLNTAIAAVMKDPDTRRVLADQGAEATTTTPEEFGRFIDSEIKSWAVVVKESGARLD